MKKVLALLIIWLMVLPACFAADSAAYIKLQISGASPDNRYFLCMPNLGCLSILAGDRGKVYPALYDLNMHPLYVSNMDNFRVYGQGLPPSCHVKVAMGQTITIHGHLVADAKGDVYIANLSCSLK